jgi:chemotaxis protein methyltransferase CheR
LRNAVVAISGIQVLQDGEFNLIKEIIHKESGIHLSDMKKALVQSRVMKRLRELKMWNYEDYCDYLANNYDTEIVNLINCITTNKTDFFREPRHFEFLKQTALPEFECAGKSHIKIWSAGCSIGAEPYSIAMSVLEHFCGRTTPDVKILATDIDTQVLRKAELGIYNASEIECIDIEMLRRYFMRGTGENNGLFKIKDAPKKITSFRRLNLLDDKYPMGGRFDIIFCRNVIIYFDTESRNKLFEKFHSYLNEDGYLIMGHSETLTGLTNRFSFIGNTIYRKVV